MSGEIARVVEWISSFDPLFAREIRGVAPDAIDMLETAQGHPCPPVHREYLLEMGAHPSWFFVDEVDFRLDALLKWHERYGTSPTPEYTVIGADRSESQSDFYLEQGEPNTWEVVSFPWHPGVSMRQTRRNYRALQAGSLPELICRVGFELYRLRPQPVHDRWYLPESALALEQLDGLLRGLGLVRLWFSTPRGTYYEHPGAAVRVVSLPEHQTVVIAGTSSSMQSAIRESVEQVCRTAF